MKRSTPILLVILFLLSACGASAVQPVCADAEKKGCQSTIISKNAKEAGPHVGVVYSLPMQFVEFDLQRKPVTKKSLKESLDKAKAANTVADKAAKDRKEAVATLEALLAASSSDDAKAKIGLDLEIQKLYLVLDLKEVEKKKEAKDKAQQRYDNFTKDYLEDQFKLTALDAVPSRHKFVAQVHRNEFSSDTIELKTTAGGLLSTGSASLSGKVDEAFVAFVGAISAAEAFKSDYGVQIHGSSFIQQDSASGQKCENKSIKLKYKFDPNEESEYVDENGLLLKLNRALAAQKICYRLRATVARPDVENVEYEGTYNGLLYPRTRTWLFDVEVLDPDTRAFVAKTDTLSVQVIDTSSIGIIPFNKSLFADNNFEFEFKNGMLTRYKSETPSELVAFLGMFPAALKAIVSVPAEIIQLKINYSSKEEGYYKAQQALILARQELQATIDSEAAEGG